MAENLRKSKAARAKGICRFHQFEKASEPVAIVSEVKDEAIQFFEALQGQGIESGPLLEDPSCQTGIVGPPRRDATMAEGLVKYFQLRHPRIPLAFLEDHRYGVIANRFSESCEPARQSDPAEVWGCP